MIATTIPQNKIIFLVRRWDSSRLWSSWKYTNGLDINDLDISDNYHIHGNVNKTNISKSPEKFSN